MNTAILQPSDLVERIDTLPRSNLAILPTGLQTCPQLAQALGGGSFHIKRDDLTGLALGGNKVRFLEFIIGEALDKNCDVLIAGGGDNQSNHAVVCTAAANRVGMRSVIVLRDNAHPRSNGNALLRQVFDARVHVVPPQDTESATSSLVSLRMAEIARQLAGNGHKPYVLETSRHGLSVVAYVNAVVELTKQTDAFAENPTRVYVTSSGAALGGILLGSRVLGIPWEVVGIDHRSTALAGMRSRVSTIMGDAAARLGLLNPVGTDDISILSSDPTTALCRPPEPWSTLSWVARNEGVLLDPVHTGWGMSIALQDLRSRPVGKDGRVIFVHTGGTATLFAHDAEVTSHLRLDRDWNAAVPGLP